MSEATLPEDFDAEAYLDLNPDVKAAGVEPAAHYLTFGHKEHRSYKRSSGERLRFLDRIGSLENFVWLLNRIPGYVAPGLHLAKPGPAQSDLDLVKRVMAAYRRAYAAFDPSAGFWDVWHHSLKKPIHDALSGSDIDAAAQVLRDPASNSFFWGFDAVAKAPEGAQEPHQHVLSRLNSKVAWQELYALWLCDSLSSLAEMVGARRVDYPEIEIDKTLGDRDRLFDVDSVLDVIEREVGIEISFPNPFADELGLQSKRGIIGFRSIQSIYQGWRIAQLSNGNPNFKVMEIGAGLGRTAYFANLFGVKNYTIVDIPLTNAAQGYFLGRVLGEREVSLGGESSNASVRIIANTDIAGHAESYDLIVNVDSWTEMMPDVAREYWNFARKATRTVLSINHEYNSHTVRELYRGVNGVRATRHPYPMRRGYIEEVISW